MCITTLANLLHPKLQYLGGKSSLVSIGLLRGAYMLAAITLKKVRDK